MSTNEKNMTKRISFRVNDEEFNRLEKEFEKSHFYKKSDFLRSIYSTYKADENQLKEWEAMRIAGKLSNELNRIGTNFNQLLKAINSGTIQQLNRREKETINEVGKYVYKVIEVLSKTNI